MGPFLIAWEIWKRGWKLHLPHIFLHFFPGNDNQVQKLVESVFHYNQYKYNQNDLLRVLVFQPPITNKENMFKL